MGNFDQKQTKAQKKGFKFKHKGPQDSQTSH